MYIHVDLFFFYYFATQEPYELVEAPVSTPLEDYKKSVVPIIEEYFSNGDVKLAASDLKELGYDDFHRYFVKKLVSMAMDRHDKEKEMASILLSSLSMEQNNSLNELPVVTYGCVAE